MLVGVSVEVSDVPQSLEWLTFCQRGKAYLCAGMGTIC